MKMFGKKYKVTIAEKSLSTGTRRTSTEQEKR